MSDIKWFSSYDDMAAALGISKDSARRLATRRKWPRQPGNDGRSRIGVPIERIPVAPPVVAPAAGEGAGADAGIVAPPDAPPVDGEGVGTVLRVLADHVERLTRDLEAVKAERDSERARAAALALQAGQVEVLNALLDAERKRVEEIRETERQRVEEWKAVADRFASQAEKLTAAAEARRSWWPWRRAG